MQFAISDKVVCIDDTGSDPLVVSKPVKGRVYVVRGLDIQPNDPEVGLYLVGLHNLHLRDGTEISMSSRRFRKLSDIQAENQLKHTRQILSHA